MIATIRLAVRIAAVAAVAAGVPPAPVTAQRPAWDREAEVEIWFAAALAHEPGTADAPLQMVMGWPRDRLDRIVADVRHTADVPRLQRALSLHTDIAIVEHAAERSSAGDPVLAIEVLDGRQSRVLARSLHWAVARAIAKALHERLGQKASTVAWYRAVAAMLQAWADCGLLAAHLEAAHEVVGADPLLALYQGTLHQTFADPRLQGYVSRTRAGADTAGRAFTTGNISGRRVGGSVSNVTGPASVPVLPRAAKREFDDAERWLRRALALDPTMAEARIRLAHVLTVSGEHAQAVEMLGPVDEAALPSFTAFYAAMVLGRSEEHLGHYAAAGAAYDRAAARYPGRQSAEIGRSRVALALGRAADALTKVVAVAGPGTTERDDPWTSYFRLHDPDAQTLLRAWRAGVK
jgi:tetratricopeptide (TPR) repeat protein